MELYISDHPLDCLTCSANGDCELQDMAGVTGLRNVRYGFDGANHLKRQKGRVQPLLQLRPVQVHRLQPLRARVRGDAGHLRADYQRARLRIARVGGARPALHGQRMRQLRRLREACPTATLQEKSVIWLGQPEHSTITTCAYCGVGCGFKAEMKGNEVVRMVPWKDGKANEGHSCVKGRFAWGYATHKDRITKPMIRAKITDPWREVSWDEAIGYAAGPSSGASRPSTARIRSAASPPAAAPTRKPTSCRSWSAPPSATTTSTPAPASAIRPPATAWARPTAPRPARRPSRAWKRPT
jgi:formate dehydrogenase major subunit